MSMSLLQRSPTKSGLFENDYTADNTGWQRPTCGLKSQVSLRKRATNYRNFLREMTCKDKASYGSWPPCTIELTMCLPHTNDIY